jgi:hypothetical protein
VDEAELVALGVLHDLEGEPREAGRLDVGPTPGPVHQLPAEQTGPEPHERPRVVGVENDLTETTAYGWRPQGPGRNGYLALVIVRELSEQSAVDAAALWHETGLTRPWNDPESDLLHALTGGSSTVLAAWSDEGRLIGTVMVGHDGHRGWSYYLRAHHGRLVPGSTP